MRQGWIMANHNAFQRENALQEQLEELQVEYHHLNNHLFLIPHPPLVYPNLGPQVIEADEEEEDMQIDVNAVEPANEEEEEENDPKEVQGVSDVDNDHFDEQLAIKSHQFKLLPPLCNGLSTMVDVGRTF